MPNPFLQELCCLLGQPVAGNPTQFMMEKLFARHALDWRYLSFEVPSEALGDAVRGIRALGFRGGNVTKPHTVAVIEYLDRLSTAAEMMGAVNCLVREDELLVGENTDGKGFLQSLAGVCDPAGKYIAVLGAGGAARAIAIELALAGAARILIVNRTPERGKALAELIALHTDAASEFLVWPNRYEIPADIEVLVQATSIGLNDPEARVPVSFRRAGSELVVADVVFNPADTAFLEKARQRGCRVLDGLGMIVNQAAIAFKLWTGIDPDTTVMREAVEEFLSL
ncbi:MAG TPA: shikimate dehydrogenase [Pirellulales bacterium]|nr:shikimate dehydrogenase [Pirellulales bacterium]